MLAKQREDDILLKIQEQYPKDIIPLPGYQDIGYEIDLSTRLIKSPEFLSVEKDHDSEIKYFVVNRYYDYKDLSTSICVICYRNAKGEDFIYPVPFLDTYTLKETHQMIIPWNISGKATSQAGDITYFFRFYDLEKENDGTLNREGKMAYNICTLPATSKILYGLELDIEKVDELDYKTDAYSELLGLIYDEDRNKTIYWNILD